MILYHGSNVSIDKPDWERSKPYKDFGRGFYLSSDEEQALRIGKLRTVMMRTGSPTVTRFSFDEALLENGEFNVKIFDDYSEEWAQFVLMNRDVHHPQPAHSFDIVYGPVADDGVTFQLRRYSAGVISLQELVKELRYSKGITFQYYFGTERALAKLIRL
ncbi:MAG: DUF3990 domain-containing protein [Bacteroidaceae bacterium]|nr:DUF3990 domain-containing protein [Bacteroidaceae bacterium]